MAMNNPDENGLFETSDTTTSESLTQIGDSCRTKGRRRATVEIGLAGGSVIAFDQFTFEGRVDAGAGVWNTLAAAWGSANEDEVVINSPSDLAALAHGTTKFAIVDCNGVEEIRFQAAQAAATGSAVTRTLKVVFANHKGGD